MRRWSHVLTALAALGIGVAFAAQSLVVDKATIGGKVYDSTAGLVQGTGITITGTAPKQTVAVDVGTTAGKIAAGDDSRITGASDAGNLSSGTVAAARGGAGTISGALKGNGSGVVSQAACADLSNAAASCSTDATNAANIGTGTLSADRLPALTNHAVIVGTGSAGTPDAVGPDASATKVLTSAGSSANPAWALAPGLLGVQYITATGAYTYTATTGTRFVVVELQGAGGGAGSVAANPGASKVNLGGGGDGGAYVRKLLTANFDGATGSVGAKGGGGASGGNNVGTAGGNTTFTTTAGSPVTYTATGGNAGGTAVGVNVPTGVGCGAGTAASGGDLNIPGGGALCGVAPSVFTGASGHGGSSVLSPGAASAWYSNSSTSAVGIDAGGYGGGGSGAVNEGTAATQKGGDGSNGIVVIWEYR